jgi:putative transposase
MRRSRYTEEQIAGILKDQRRAWRLLSSAVSIGSASRLSNRWKAKYGGLEVSDAQRLRQLEEENRKLKQLVAEQALDIVGFKAVLGKKW